MDRISAYFCKTKSRETSDKIMVPENYDFWSSLIKYFIKKADSFRIDCWINEHEAVERAQYFGKSLPCELDNMKVFGGYVTQEFINELINNPFDSTGKIRWFSIFLMNGEKTVISCEHYGSEFATGRLEPEDIKFLRACVPEDFIFHIFNEEEF